MMDLDLQTLSVLFFADQAMKSLLTYTTRLVEVSTEWKCLYWVLFLVGKIEIKVYPTFIDFGFLIYGHAHLLIYIHGIARLSYWRGTLVY